MGTDIIDQNTQIQNTLTDVQNQETSYERLNEYQQDMYHAVKYVNTVLIVLYIFLFTVIHVLFLEQYLTGIERSEFWDTIWLTVFFFYPYFIYLVEQEVYFMISYIASFIYGNMYVYQFDKIMTNTDFYSPPN
jgi:TM2 domain-containing membrane protein YozV